MRGNYIWELSVLYFVKVFFILFLICEVNEDDSRGQKDYLEWDCHSLVLAFFV